MSLQIGEKVTVGAVAEASLLGAFQGLPADHDAALLRRIWEVTGQLEERCCCFSC